MCEINAVENTTFSTTKTSTFEILKTMIFLQYEFRIIFFFPTKRRMSTFARLPDFFPATSKNCTNVAEPFFTCFTEKSVKNSPTDTEAGQRGLTACAKELKAYSACMEKELNSTNKGEKLKFRVRMSL